MYYINISQFIWMKMANVKLKRLQIYDIKITEYSMQLEVSCQQFYRWLFYNGTWWKCFLSNKVFFCCSIAVGHRDKLAGRLIIRFLSNALLLHPSVSTTSDMLSCKSKSITCYCSCFPLKGIHNNTEAFIVKQRQVRQVLRLVPKAIVWCNIMEFWILVSFK